MRCSTLNPALRLAMLRAMLPKWERRCNEIECSVHNRNMIVTGNGNLCPDCEMGYTELIEKNFGNTQ